ncbi:MAG: hypothetical protein JKX84_10005, partial [Flavobacteriales bacterium]|nr:hypothetical protein [Flavobacteriales bacterium]
MKNLTSLLFLCISFLFTSNAIAQNCNGVGSISESGIHSYIVPQYALGSEINLEIRGGGGGAAFSGPSAKEEGGVGTTVFGKILIGNEPGQIPLGSELRIIIGEQGETHGLLDGVSLNYVEIAGGGGGSAVFLKRPGETNYTLLMVAGGGGGASSHAFGGFSGKAGSLTTDGTNGGSGYFFGISFGGGAGGQNGFRGNSYTNSGNMISGGGGGAFGGIDQTCLSGHQADVTGLEISLGGGTDASTVIQPTCTSDRITKGGSGFGGGGAGISGSLLLNRTSGGAGGGGGYSGGGGGGGRIESLDFGQISYLISFVRVNATLGGPGGGGGSYVNGEYVFDANLVNSMTPEFNASVDGFFKATIPTVVLNYVELDITVKQNITGPVCQFVPLTFSIDYSLYPYAPNSGSWIQNYEWFRNGVPVGSGSNMDEYTASYSTENDIITCNVTGITSNGCAYPTQGTGSLTPSVDFGAQSVVSISAWPGTAVCSGNNVVFTAVASPQVPMPDYQPSYQWYRNGIAVGTDDPQYTTNSINDQDQIKCEVSHAGCPVQNASNVLVMDALPPFGGELVGPTRPCKGTQAFYSMVGVANFSYINWTVEYNGAPFNYLFVNDTTIVLNIPIGNIGEGVMFDVEATPVSQCGSGSVHELLVSAQPTPDTWSPIPSFSANGGTPGAPGSAGMDRGASFSIGKYGYVMGGQRFSAHLGPNYVQDNLWRFDTENELWEVVDDSISLISIGSAGFSIEGKGYAIGGSAPQVTNNGGIFLWEFDTATSKVVANLLPNPDNVSFGYPVAVTMDSVVFIGVGGTHQWYVYNPANGIWTRKADFPGCSGGACDLMASATAFRIDTSIYVVGGARSPSGFPRSWDSTDDVYRYDIPSDTWTQMNDFPGGSRSGAVSFSIGGNGYIAGGREHRDMSFLFFYYTEYDTIPNIYNDTWKYNPSNNQWTEVSSLTFLGDPYLPDYSYNWGYNADSHLGDYNASVFTVGTEAYFVGGSSDHGGQENGKFFSGACVPWNISAIDSMPFCESVTLDAGAHLQDGDCFTWSTGQARVKKVTFDVPGTQTVSVTYEGCTSKPFTFTIQPYVTPSIDLVFSDQVYCTADTMEFTNVLTHAGTNPIYYWTVHDSVFTPSWSAADTLDIRTQPPLAPQQLGELHFLPGNSDLLRMTQSYAGIEVVITMQSDAACRTVTTVSDTVIIPGTNDYNWPYTYPPNGWADSHSRPYNLSTSAAQSCDGDIVTYTVLEA